MFKTKDELETADDNWNTKAEYEGWRCEVCASIPAHSEREIFFETGLCGWCSQMATKDD